MTLVNNPTTRDLRRINRSKALRTVYFQGPLSRLQVSKVTDLSPATVSNVIGELLAEGILVESGSVESEVGRPRTLISINSHYGYFVGVDVGETLIRISVFDVLLSSIGNLAIPLSQIENPPSQIGRAISSGIDKLIVQIGLAQQQIIGAGIAMPGIVDEGSRVTVFAPNWAWRDVPFKEELELRLEFPFVLDKGPNAQALAEELLGGGPGSGSTLVLSLGNGVGAGIVEGGQLYRGVGNGAGEWGHTIIDIDGLACRCGRRGCLEAYVGSEGIIRRYFGGDESGASSHEDQYALIKSMFDAAKEGDPRAMASIDETIRYLGVGVANLVNLFNPERIRIGGWVGGLFGEDSLGGLREIVARYALRQSFDRCSIERSGLREDSNILGAAASALMRFLENAGPDSRAKPPKRLPRGAKASSRVVRILAVSGLETDVLIEHARDFEEGTGIGAHIDQVTRQQWGSKKVQELIEDSGHYDIVMVGGGDDLLWVKLKGHVQRLDKYLSPEDAGQLMHREYFQDKGELFGVPLYFNFPMLYYRKDLLDDPTERKAFRERFGREISPPRNFTELSELASFFHRPPEMHGFFFGGVDWSVFLDYTFFCFGAGANFGDLETGELTLNTPAAIHAMTALTRMSAFNPPGWRTMSFFDAERLFKAGKVFMYQNWMYATKSLSAAMPGRVGIAPAVGDLQPGEHLGAFVAVMPRSAPDSEAAGRFISWILSKDYQKAQSIETGDLPVRQDVLEDRVVQGALIGFEQYQHALPYLTYQHTTWFNELSLGISEAIGKVFSEGLSPKQALDWLQTDKFKNRKAIE